MRVKLTEPHDWRVPGKRQVISYKPGEHTVRRECGEEMIAAGKAKEIRSPGKKSENAD